MSCGRRRRPRSAILMRILQINNDILRANDPHDRKARHEGRHHSQHKNVKDGEARWVLTEGSRSAASSQRRSAAVSSARVQLRLAVGEGCSARPGAVVRGSSSGSAPRPSTSSPAAAAPAWRPQRPPLLSSLLPSALPPRTDLSS